jgi:branched-chain amino acid aminotransferase
MTSTVSYNVTRTPKSRLSEVNFEDLKFGQNFADHMLVAHYEDGQWGTPEILPYGNLSLSPATSAIHYGQSCFEGLKAYRLENGEIRVWRPDQNFIRINKSAERLCMPAIPEEFFMDGIQQLVSLDRDWVPTQDGSSLYIRPFLFATDPFVGIRPSLTYSFIIFCCPVGVYYAEPLRVRVEEHFSRAMHGGTGYAKAAGNYAGALYPTLMAQKEGFHQLIWTDSNEHKYIEEAGTMNIMFVLDGKLVTSPIGDTILKGVTRDSVLTLARGNGLEVEERKVSVDELKEALAAGKLQDAFGVGTAATFAPIKEMELYGKRYTLPDPSPISLALRKEMEDIRTGKAVDKYNWLYKV